MLKDEGPKIMHEVTLSRLELETFSIPNCALLEVRASSRRCDNQLHHSARYA